MAPEILQRQGYNRAVDWWAVGVMIYRMLLRKFPFGGILRSTIFGRITHQEPTFPKHLSHNAVDITSNLLDKNPSSRLGSSIRGAEDVKMSPFFKVCLCFRHLKTHCHDKK
ncbi:serine/threonine-protein kinase N1-like [Xenopus tropicalis]|uniref:Serine/threonine-protein kinase N1-like n=1 Tax=Xenopus tropicalis TaxID=8364 RepID=A0A8J1IZG9_XENTR|nr:serine/threonine-protein kinase N1-like [Xenopus tropicalis]